MPTVIAANRRDLAGFAVADGADAGDTFAMYQDGGQRRHVMMQANGLQKALEIIGRMFIRRCGMQR